jgi:prepilin-type N-terminal cleavage/methylation domain-containing protein
VDIRTVSHAAHRRSRIVGAAGFTLLEVLMVVALIAVVASMAVPISGKMIARAKADSTGVEVQSWLDAARNRAIAERRNFQITFDTSTHRVRVQRVEPGGSLTLILERNLPEGMRFIKFPGTADTPDAFGNATAVDLDGPNPHMFTSDGSFIDGNGDPSNGTVLMGKPSQVESARALTIFGTTGLMRAWKFTGLRWYQ